MYASETKSVFFWIFSNFLFQIIVCKTEIFIEISISVRNLLVESRIMDFGLVHLNWPSTFTVFVTFCICFANSHFLQAHRPRHVRSEYWNSHR